MGSSGSCGGAKGVIVYRNANLPQLYKETSLGLSQSAEKVFGGMISELLLRTFSVQSVSYSAQQRARF